MIEETQVAVQEKKVDAPVEWGSREEITALSKRLRAMMPGKLSQQEALLLAQYSAALDANPFRGEVYAFENRGKIVLVEGYKLLVRWARRQCNFYERYERITDDTDAIAKDVIAFRCRILRQDAVGDLAALTTAGVPNAYEICSIEAVGVVKKSHRPPEGWTVEAVARKRALKNALNRAYGAPSPREIARETWVVEDTLTVPEDWKDVTPEMLPAEREATAFHSARRRLSPPLEQTFAESMDDLGFPVEEPPQAPQAPPGAESEEETGQTTDEAAVPPQGATGNGSITRPADPVTVRGWLTDKAQQLSHYRPPTPNQLGLMNGLLSKILGGDKERHSWLEWTWGDPSSKEMLGGQVGATLNWLKPEKDAETSEYIPHPFAVSECKMMLRQAMLDKGQADMFDDDMPF